MLMVFRWVLCFFQVLQCSAVRVLPCGIRHRCKYGESTFAIIAWGMCTKSESKYETKELHDGLFVLQVVAAPTGSGKTVILELAILHMLSQCIDEHGQYHHRKKLLRAIYLAPNKALVQVGNLSVRLLACAFDTPNRPAKGQSHLLCWSSGEDKGVAAKIWAATESQCCGADRGHRPGRLRQSQ